MPGRRSKKSEHLLTYLMWRGSETDERIPQHNKTQHIISTERRSFSIQHIGITFSCHNTLSATRFYHQLRRSFPSNKIILINMTILNPLAVLLLSTVFTANNAFVPTLHVSRVVSQLKAETFAVEKTDSRTGKPTGTSFLPEEAIERASKGNPIEKAKLQKDGTSAFVDVYEYARKIREGEMTWEEVEKADLNTVSLGIVWCAFSKIYSLFSSFFRTHFENCTYYNIFSHFLLHIKSEAQVCWSASPRQTYTRPIHDAS